MYQKLIYYYHNTKHICYVYSNKAYSYDFEEYGYDDILFPSYDNYHFIYQFAEVLLNRTDTPDKVHIICESWIPESERNQVKRFNDWYIEKYGQDYVLINQDCCPENNV